MGPLISCVCLTTHPKRSAYLPDALRSYRAQTYPRRELVVVNDGSPLVSAAPDVTVVNLPDRGTRWTVGEKRNVGLRFATGEFVATWDDDDISLPHRLAVQAAFAERFGADVVLADRAHVADNDMVLAGNCDRGGRPIQASTLLRRSAAVAVGGYAVCDYLEDCQMLESIRRLRRGVVMVIGGSDFYVLRRHASNVTLDFGERGDTYMQCALRTPSERAAQQIVDGIRSGPGGGDAHGAG